MDIKILLSCIRIIWTFIISIAYIFLAYVFVFEEINYAVSTKIILVMGLFLTLKNIYSFLFGSSDPVNKVLSFFCFVASFLYAVAFVYVLLCGHFW